MDALKTFSNRGNQINWAEIASGLGQSVLDLDASIKGKRAEDEQIYRTTGQALDDTEQAKTPTLNEFILAGADSGRQKIFNWNQELKKGKISRNEYKRRMMNLNDYWENLGTVTKTLDTRIQQSLERQQVGEDGSLPPASEIEVEMQGYFGALSNLKNRRLDIDDEGKVMLATLGDDGSPMSLESVKYINNPLNTTFNRTDVNGMVKAGVDNWQSWDIGLVSDIRKNPNFAKSKLQLIDAITSSPRSSASVLVDYSNDDYTVYFNEQDRQNKLAELKRINSETNGGLTDAQMEGKLIQMKQDELGNYQPVLTQDQQKVARGIVDREIEMQLGRKVDLAPRYGGNGRDSDKGPSAQELISGYTSTLKAFGYNPQSVATSGGDSRKWGWNPDNINFSGLNPSYKYVYKGGKVMVYDKGSDVLNGGIGGESNLLFVANKPEELAQYIYRGNDPSQNPVYWQDARKMYQAGVRNSGRTSSFEDLNKDSKAYYNKKNADAKNKSKASNDRKKEFNKMFGG